MANTPTERGAFMTHLSLVVASLFVGTGVWLVVQLTETEETTLDVPVVPFNVEEEVDLNLLTRSVPVKFSYPAAEQIRMQPDNFMVMVDFGGWRERVGKNLQDSGDRTVSRENVRGEDWSLEEFNISVVDVVSPVVGWEAELRWAPARIEPVITGKPRPGFRYERATIEGGPDADRLIVLLAPRLLQDFRASGAEAMILPTTPVDISGQPAEVIDGRGVVREQVSLVLPDGVRLLPGESPHNRTAVVELVEESITRVLEDVPITYEFIFAAEGLDATIQPPTVDVAVTGRLSAVNALTPEMITFGLFGVAEEPGERREVAVETRVTDQRLRAQITNVETRPRTVTVSITAQQEASPTATPTPTPQVTPAAQTFAVIVEDSSPEQREELRALFQTLPQGFSFMDFGSPRDGVAALRVVSSEQPIAGLLEWIVEASEGLSFELDFTEQTRDTIRLRAEGPRTVAPAATAEATPAAQQAAAEPAPPVAAEDQPSSPSPRTQPESAPRDEPTT